MKFFILDKKVLAAYALMGVILISVLGMNLNRTVSVFSDNDRQIPIYCVDRDDNKVALTFDVAWDDADTQAIVDALNKYNVKCSFFIVGEWLDKYPESAKLLADNGHELLNHSDTHPYMTKLSSEEMQKEINSCDEKLRNITGKDLKLFRAPYGDYDNEVINTASTCGHKTIQWDVDSLDWKDLTTDEIVTRVTTKTLSGSIILMHLGAKNTPEALPMIIEKLQANGFNLVPVSEMIYTSDFVIDNSGKQKQSSPSE